MQKEEITKINLTNYVVIVISSAK